MSEAAKNLLDEMDKLASRIQSDAATLRDCSEIGGKRLAQIGRALRSMQDAAETLDVAAYDGMWREDA